MEYLLDTHTLLWLLFAPGKLPENVRKILRSIFFPPIRYLLFFNSVLYCRKITEVEL